MALRGTLTGISGRRVFFRAEDAGKDDKPQEFRMSGGDAIGPMKVLRQTGEKDGKPEYAQAFPADLRNGMAVRLMGPPNADLHTIVILPDDEQPDAQRKAVKASVKAPAQGISEDLDQHTVVELRDIAGREGISLHGATNKDEIVKEIKAGRRKNKASA